MSSVEDSSMCEEEEEEDFEKPQQSLALGESVADDGDEIGSEEEGGEIRAPRLTCQWAPAPPVPHANATQRDVHAVLMRSSALSEGLSDECKACVGGVIKDHFNVFEAAELSCGHPLRAVMWGCWVCTHSFSLF